MDWQSLPNPDKVDTDAFGAAYELWEQLSEAGKSKPKIQRALDVASGACRLYGHGARVFASFNGGKDAVAVLHLLRAALAGYCVRHSLPLARVRCVYFEDAREFGEVTEFVNRTAETYDLDMVRFDCGFADGLTQLVERESGGLAFVLGTRRGDPNCGEQEHFCPASEWMPPFMRVNPVLHWDYGDVWDFLREFGLTWCVLYDQGYSSLGHRENTQRNPSLRRPGSPETYDAAWTMTDFTLERAGRAGFSKKPHVKEAGEDQ
jgi:FAD synthetase